MPSFVSCFLAVFSMYTRSLGAGPSIRSSNDGQVETDPSDLPSASLVLLSVPLAWGTFEPAVRFVYNVAPEIPTIVFSVAYYAVAVTGLFLVLLLEQQQPNAQPADTKDQSVAGGIELGLYLFLGNALQVFGLRTVPSDRAAFLLQLTTIFVPLLQAVSSGNLKIISKRVWLASFMALAGVAIISMDSAENSILLIQPSLSKGDAMIVGAAVLYTFHCVRLELYAKSTSAIQLAFTKAATELSLSTAAACILVFGSFLAMTDSPSNTLLASWMASGESIESFLHDFSDTLNNEDGGSLLAAGAATTWIGLITVAYTICAQSYGQKYIPAATANLIYTLQPLFTALFAWSLLGETLGTKGYAGALVVLLAVWIVVFDGTSDTKSNRRDLPS